MKNIFILMIFFTLLISPVFAEQLIKIGEKFDAFVYIDKDSIKPSKDHLYTIEFNTKLIFKKGLEEKVKDQKAAYEKWDVKANCENNEFIIEKMYFYDDKDQLLETVETEDLPFVTFKGKSLPGSNIRSVIYAACQQK